MNNRDIAFEDLKKIVSERSQPIVFWTGAGVSAPLPSWRGLLDEIIKIAKSKVSTLSESKALSLSIDFSEKTSDLWVAFEKLSSNELGIGQESFRQAVKRALSDSNSAQIPEIQRLLWRTRPKGIITLNLDLFTQRASSEVADSLGIPIPILPAQFGQNISVFKENRPFIAYPHGNLDDFDTWTFTASSLSTRLSDNSYLSWISALLANFTVIFVGITADDVAVGGMFDRIVKSQGISFRGNYWITSRTDSDTDSWAESRGIRVIRYDAPKNDHSQLVKLLTELAGFRATENRELEAPVQSGHLSTITSTLPPPDEIDLRNKEQLREQLNGHAQYIFSQEYEDDAERDKKFRDFLTNYADAVHNSYYTSTVEGKNKFLGYNLIRRASGGAFGTVYHALDDSGNPLAIKILHAEKLGEQDFYRNFRRGVNSLRILTSRNVEGIVKFSDAVEIPPALIMEWVDGATLSDLVHQSQLSSWYEKLNVLNRLALVLRNSHALPERVLHRDLRPANVMLRDYWSDPEKLDVVVLDFDLSWHRGAEDHSIMYSPALGYLAPEQRRRISNSTTRTSLVDSYGLGMVMYFVITGNDPIPDIHLTRSWESEIERISSSKPCREWRSIPKRISRLIVAATKEDQHSRLEVTQIQSELQSLIGYLDNPSYLTAVSILVEELAMRTAHLQGYVWNDQSSKAELHISQERRTSLQAEIASRRIILNIEWMNAGTQDWGHINRLLENGFPRLVDALESAKWKVSHTKQRRSFHVSAVIDAEELIVDLDGGAKSLDKALGHAFSIAGQ